MSAMNALEKAADYMRAGIWRVRIDEVTGARRILIRCLRIIIIAFEKFFQDRCILRASSLTFYSALSIVPVLAMAFAIAKGFGLQNRLEQLIIEQLAGQEEVVARLIGFSRNLLQDTSGGIIAGVGAAFLFWVAISIMSSAEETFNHIWKIERARTISRKLTDYLALFLVAPLLLIVSSSATVLVVGQINRIMGAFGFLGVISPLVTLIVQIVPYMLIWVLFSFVYLFLPNTRVSFSSGVIAGIVAGTAFVVVQWTYIFFQVGVARYNAIYGSFAALPLFLVWMQISWYIVLFGVEISYAHQNERVYEFAPDVMRTSRAFKRVLSLRVMHLVVKNFSEGNPPLSEDQITYRLGLPVLLARDILAELTAASLLTPIPAGVNGRVLYQPARSTHDLSISSVIESLENRGESTLPVNRDDAFASLSHALEAFARAVESSPENRLLKDI
ncbi:MAG: YihY/virulence factor BrkB family protein [Desulfomonilia bacterium]|jgi:membrane protein